MNVLVHYSNVIKVVVKRLYKKWEAWMKIGNLGLSVQIEMGSFLCDVVIP